MFHQGRVESLESREALDFLEDGLDVFVFELQGFHLLVHEITDLDDIGNSAGIVATHHLPGEPAQPGRMAERLERMMQQGGLREGFRGDPGTAAEFDGQGRRTSAMRVFGGRVEAHWVSTI